MKIVIVFYIFFKIKFSEIKKEIIKKSNEKIYKNILYLQLAIKIILL